MRRTVRRVIEELWPHLLLILGLLTLLAITVILWGYRTWPVEVVAVLTRALLLIGVLGGGLGILVLLWRLPKWQAARPELTPLERFTVENEARKTLAQIVGGAAVLASLYFTWGALEVSREGQITDRFTKAIAQLGEQGPEKLAVRLGSIYALERIARDSATDHWPIMEVLTAYVREHAPWPPKRSKEVQPSEGNQSPQEEPRATINQPPPKLTADIQAILTVIGRRARTYGKGEDQRLNLANADLRGAALYRAHLEGALLVEAQLQEANLWDAQLQEALLGGAQLQKANLAGAQLQGADLRGAQLQGALLTVKQLSVVRTLYQATLDPPLLEQIRERYAPLLEDPWERVFRGLLEVPRERGRPE